MRNLGMDHILITHLKARRTAMDLTTPAVINRFLILDYLNVGFGVAVNLHSKNDVRLSQFNFQYRGREYSLIFTEAPAYAILLCCRSGCTEVVKFIDHVDIDQNDYVTRESRVKIVRLISDIESRFYFRMLVNAEAECTRSTDY